jgi:hypothetical protein
MEVLIVHVQVVAGEQDGLDPLERAWKCLVKMCDNMCDKIWHATKYATILSENFQWKCATIFFSFIKQIQDLSLFRIWWSRYVQYYSHCM